MSQLTTTEPLAVTAAPANPALRRVLHRAAFWSVIAAIFAAALVLGLILRRWAWDQTEPIRYLLDINNAFRQGSFALTSGYIDRYDDQASAKQHDVLTDLDYAPGRLAVATVWARWVHHRVDWYDKNRTGPNPWLQNFYQQARLQQRQYELCKPLLMLNLTGEILSAVAMFFLVRRYTSGRLPNYRPTRGIVLGLFSALLFWFNPALIFNAHCWPQWDSWVLPFFLWALLLASLDWWFCAGAIVAIAAMFKGQILFGAPLLLLWPLFQGRLAAVARWVIGLFTATAAVAAVWLVRIPGTNPTGAKFIPGSVNPHAIDWVVYLALILAAMASLIRGSRKSYWRLPVGVLVAAVLAWMIAAHTNRVISVIAFAMLAAGGWYIDEQSTKWDRKARLPLQLVAGALLIYPIYVLARHWVVPVLLAAGVMAVLLKMGPRRAIGYAAAAWMAAALLMCPALFKTSNGWFTQGIAYGTHHFERMAAGQNDNLAELLRQDWEWDDLMAPALALPRGQLSDSIGSFLTTVDPKVRLEDLKTPDGGIGLPLKYLLFSIWAVSLILCSMAAAVHDRNRSPRFLLAICTPWIVFFAVMTQMHERYLLWGASLSAAAAALSPGYLLLHLFLSVVAMSQEFQTAIDGTPYAGNPLHLFFNNWHPGIAWAVLVTAGVFLYSTLKWDKSARPGQ